MNKVVSPAPQLANIIPYDPKYIPANAMMSANENPSDISQEIRNDIRREVHKVNFNRYPDPLANELREMIAEANGLDRDWVLMGNGGDELLFNTALAWGGPGRNFLNLPPTFSVYAANARLTGTNVVDVPRLSAPRFDIDEDAVMERLSRKGADRIHYTIVASPNNPTGLRAKHGFFEKALAATDALVMADEAYFEFSRETTRPLLALHENLVILRTFSKAFSLAGVRLGYILANPDVIREYIKVRQPYSVDAISQAVGRVIFRNRAKFVPAIEKLIEGRDNLIDSLNQIPGVTAYPSDSNWVLFRIGHADEAWEYVYNKGILLRDFSHAEGLEDTLRVTVGTPEQNGAFLDAIREFVDKE